MRKGSVVANLLLGAAISFSLVSGFFSSVSGVEEWREVMKNGESVRLSQSKTSELFFSLFYPFFFIEVFTRKNILRDYCNFKCNCTKSVI